MNDKTLNRIGEGVSKDVYGDIRAKCDSNHHLQDFFRFMALCHSVMVDHDPKTGEIIYQASSPDELALVKASNDVGIKLAERTKDNVEIVENNVQKSYQILAEFPFNSDRKRMSVIIENESKYYIYCKGADNIMIPRVNWKPGERDLMIKDLDKYAVKGLRTLVMAKKEITSSDYKTFASKQNELETSDLKNKEELLFELYDSYEFDFDFVGASAIEDRLQNNVPQTIAKLMSASIRIWVLTGDKQETAIEIAKSCKLIQKDMKVRILTIKIDENTNPKSALDTLEKRIIGLKAEAQIKESDIEEGFKNVKLRQDLSIVIDGPTLELILGDKDIELKFFSLALYARSVVCCRVSPKQKAMVVRLSKYK